jgi:hypothetical protein
MIFDRLRNVIRVNVFKANVNWENVSSEQMFLRANVFQACRNFVFLLKIGAEALTSDDLKFGRCCFGALWIIFFEKFMMQNCTDTDKEQFCIIHFSKKKKKMLPNAPKQLCPYLRSSEVRASSPIKILTALKVNKKEFSVAVG